MALNGRQPLGSVVIPAHNEARVIGRSLDVLLAGFGPGELDVVVVCNGCTDATATVARSADHSVRVVELEQASKPAALRAGDVEAAVFPRLYVDADVAFPGSAARLVLARLRAGAVAARPLIRYDTTGASAPVRSYYRARCRVPAVMSSLWGAGAYGLSAAGRSRFGDFPDVVADDLWVDRLFDRREVEIVGGAAVVVAVPRRTRDLVRTLRRTYRGKAEMASEPDARRPQATASALRDLARLSTAGPRAALDAVTYSAFAAGARLALAVVQVVGDPLAVSRWERDDSSRAS
jgi:glycosyltransferase involved in cell wall biosynthesis